MKKVHFFVSTFRFTKKKSLQFVAAYLINLKLRRSSLHDALLDFPSFKTAASRYEVVNPIFEVFLC